MRLLTDRVQTSENDTVSAGARQGQCGTNASSPGVRGGVAERAWLIRRFYVSMLGIVAIDACFAVIYGVSFERFWPTALVMTVLMLAGAHGIFQPVRRYLQDPWGVRLPVRAVATLSTRCTVYVAVVVSALAVVKFLFLPLLLDFDMDALLTRNEQLWLPVIHTLYYTVLIYFVMADYEGSLRARIFEWHGDLIPATRGRLVHRLIAAFVVTSLLPVGMIVLHTLERDLAREKEALLEDLTATALAVGVCLTFVTRSLLRPIRALESAMTRVQQNDLDVNVPVLSNDETGRLADGFNRMVRGLRERALIRQNFGRYVPERVVAGAGGRPAERVLLGRRRDHRVEPGGRHAVPG